MNAIFFGLKRAFHSTLRITRAKLASMGLTAARFDMLFALLDAEPRPAVAALGFRVTTTQSQLRRTLGVSRPTTSRMLASLEKLGFVSRVRSRSDRRQIEVALTTEGRARIRRAHLMFRGSGWAQLAVDTALGSDGAKRNRWYDESHCFVEMATLEAYLTKIRKAYRDFARLYYRWNMDH